MQISDISKIITNKVNGCELSNDTYISTENMLPNCGGVTISSSVPTTKVTAFLKEDILLSNIRPYFKKVWFARFDGGCSNDVICLRADKEQCLPQYLYYVLSTDKFIDSFSASSKGTKMPRGDKNALLSYDFPERSIKEQLYIVDILGSIDAKIELNEEIIRKCNEILTTCFELFFAEIKNNVSRAIGTLDIIVSDFVANGSFADLKKNVQILEEPSYAYFIRNTDLKAYSFQKYVDKSTYDFLSKSSLYGNEVLISNVGDVGSVFLCPKLDKKMTLGNNMIYINSIGESYYNFYLCFLFLSEEGQYLIRGITGGSAQPKFNKTDFRNTLIPIPDKNQLELFNEEVIPYLQKIDHLRAQNNKLNELKQLYLKKFFG